MLPQKLSALLESQSDLNPAIFELCTHPKNSVSLNDFIDSSEILSILNNLNILYSVNADNELSLTNSSDRIDFRIYNKVEDIPDDIILLVQYWRDEMEYIRNYSEGWFNTMDLKNCDWFEEIVENYAKIRYNSLGDFIDECDERINDFETVVRVTKDSNWECGICYLIKMIDYVENLKY